MSHLSRPPRGQQRDKPYREALRIELAAAGENMMALREIAKVHIAKCKDGDMRAIKELADRLDGKPAQILDLSDPDSNPIKKIVTEIVHVNLSPEELSALNEAEELRANGSGRSDANGSGGLNGSGCDRDRR
jgi:hypothetical protein